MPVNIKRWVWLSGLVLLMSGCDTGSDVAPTIQGTYTGLLTFIVGDEEIEEFWTLSLAETGGEMSGTGTLGTTQVVITGTHDHPDVTLNFVDGEGTGAGRVTGTASDDGQSLTGRYTFSVFFANLPIRLTRGSNPARSGDASQVVTAP